MAIRQDVLIFWKPVNFIAEMQGVMRQSNLYEKEVCHFHEFHIPCVLVGLPCAVKYKKNCRIKKGARTL